MTGTSTLATLGAVASYALATVAFLHDVAACGHAEPPKRAASPTLAALPAASGFADASDASIDAEASPEGLDGASERRASAQDVEDGGLRPARAAADSRCLTDAGSPARILIRFVNRRRSGAEVPRGCFAADLSIEIPSLGFTRQLCGVSCGPFHFDSQKNGAEAATFVCENDFVLQDGTAWVADGVLYYEAHDKVFAGNPFGPAHPAPRRPLQPEAVPLPCGTRPEMKTAGPLWMKDSRVRGSSL